MFRNWNLNPFFFLQAEFLNLIDLSKYLQEFDNVAGAEETVRGGELERLRPREIRGQHALVAAPPAKDLAGSAGAVDYRRRRRGRDGRRRRRRGGIRRGGEVVEAGGDVTRLHGDRWEERDRDREWRRGGGGGNCSLLE